MKEYIDSCWKNIEKRMSSPIYGSLIVSWIIFNFELVITLFFISENFIFEKYGLLKNEYLYLFLDLKNGWNWIRVILLPVISTWLAIWILPNLILFKAFQKDEEYEFKKKQERLTNELKIQGLKNELVDKEKEEKDKIIDVIKVENKIKEEAPEKIWEKEYNELINTPYFNSINDIITSIYRYGGSVRYNAGVTSFQISPNNLAFFESRDIVKFIDDEQKKISFTEKGKYFVKLYQDKK